MTVDTLLHLIQTLESLVKEEQAIKKERARLEAKLVKSFPAALGSSKTHKHNGYKITTKAPVNYRLDVGIWHSIEDKIPRSLRPVQTKIAADAAGCKWLANSVPDLSAICAQAITATPGKPAVTVQPTPTDE